MGWLRGWWGEGNISVLKTLKHSIHIKTFFITAGVGQPIPPQYITLKNYLKSKQYRKFLGCNLSNIITS